MYNNPAIFGTDIALTHIQPFVTAQNEIAASITQRLGLTRNSVSFAPVPIGG
jgi:hypothetical protein